MWLPESYCHRLDSSGFISDYTYGWLDWSLHAHLSSALCISCVLMKNGWRIRKQIETTVPLKVLTKNRQIWLFALTKVVLNCVHRVKNAHVCLWEDFSYVVEGLSLWWANDLEQKVNLQWHSQLSCSISFLFPLCRWFLVNFYTVHGLFWYVYLTEKISFYRFIDMRIIQFRLINF